MTPFLLAAAMIAASVASAFVALATLSAIGGKKPSPPAQTLAGPIEPTVFLFNDRDLVDATPPARRLLDRMVMQGSEWDRLVAYLAPKIPDFLPAMATLAEKGGMRLESPSHPDFRLDAEFLGQTARLTLTDLSSEGQGVVVDGLSLRAQEDEVSSLRETVASMPLPAWRGAADGAVIWANDAYLDLARDNADDESLVWPLPLVFDAAAPSGHLPRRVRTRSTAGRDLWFDWHRIAAGDGALNYAVPADAAVKAEGALRDFVQTLTKTFAQLPIGLAIFDRARQLALFNPSLIDLTSLDAEFLSARPTLFSFLDRLREARILPEPKDYVSWRQRMHDLEKAAASGLYEETWTLPTGQTYRVTGRPHPDGAVAFLIEDISAEISLTRRFRSEIELGQSVIDALGEAVAVFSHNGELVLSNAAYGRLWGIDPGAALGTVSIVDSTRHWQAMTRPTPVWGDLRDFIGDPGERAEWDADVALKDDQPLACRFVPMSGGATLVTFSGPARDRPVVRRSRRARNHDERADEGLQYLT